jgi:hypothetical protein
MSTRDDLSESIHDVFQAQNPALYRAIVALLAAGCPPEALTRYIDAECRRARGGVAGLTENAAAVTIEVLVRRRADPFGGSVLDEPRPVTAADEAALDVERRREWEMEGQK